VDDALSMGSVECVRDLYSHREDLFNRKRLAFNAMFQRFPVPELHHDERLTILLAYVANSANVGMAQSGRGLRFALQARQRLGVARNFFWEKLENNKSAEPVVLRFLDDTHASAAQFFQDSEMRDCRANRGWRLPWRTMVGRPQG
jgi:hypothetical protein